MNTVSILAGKHEGFLIGVAPDIQILLAKTEYVPEEEPIEEDHWVQALEWGEELGADVVTSSLGYSDWYDHSDMDGKTAVTTRAANIAVIYLISSQYGYPYSVQRILSEPVMVVLYLDTLSFPFLLFHFALLVQLISLRMCWFLSSLRGMNE